MDLELSLGTLLVGPSLEMCGAVGYDRDHLVEGRGDRSTAGRSSRAWGLKQLALAPADVRGSET
jgi:hypothetical protein